MLYIKALHIIFVVTWFAGLFYLVRLFVYHAEANEKQEPERSILLKHFQLAEKRLWFGITVPSAYGTIIFGTWLLYDLFGSTIPDWMYVKLAFVIGLLIYHIICGRIVAQLKSGVVKYSSMQMRFFNEIATVFLISIVFLVVLKDSLSWIKGVAGLLIFSLLLVTAIKLYKKMRSKN